MPTTLRLTKDEQKLLEQKTRELNKSLIGDEMKPITESELAHVVLKEGLQRVSYDKRKVIDIG